MFGAIPNFQITTAILLRHQRHSDSGCSISLWETAKAVEYGRLTLPLPVAEWLASALTYPGGRLIELTPEIAFESTRLPGAFHKDPADQMIVATARVLKSRLATIDSEILKYPHVDLMT